MEIASTATADATRLLEKTCVIKTSACLVGRGQQIPPRLSDSGCTNVSETVSRDTPARIRGLPRRALLTPARDKHGIDSNTSRILRSEQSGPALRKRTTFVRSL